MVLVVSLLALLVGPCLVALAGRRRSTTLALDAFVLTAVAGMVMLHVLPEAVGRAGLWTLAAAAVGLTIPLLIERGMRPGGATKVFVVGFALLGMGLHAALDGIALTSEADHGHVLAWAVILHRIPVGIGIWWIVARTLGKAVALATLGVTAVGTWIGYTYGPDIWSSAGLQTAGLLEAMLAGSLIHVVLHSDIPAPKGVEERRGLHWASLGGVLAALVVLRFVLAHEHAHDHDGGGHVHGAEFSLATVSEVFLGLVLESAPILLLAYLFVGFAHVFLPSTWVDRMNAKTTVGQAFRGVAVGLPLPVCSCGVVPIYKSLVQKGAAAAAALAFLVATPELEIAAIALTAKLMGMEFAVSRLIAAAALALLVGSLIGRFASKTGVAPGPSELPEESCCASNSASTDTETEPETSKSLGARMREAVRFGWTDAVDDTLPWIVFGLMIAALLSPFAESVDLDALPGGLEVPIAALLGLPIYVCASGSTPIAAFMLIQGVSPGAVLAFLLTGPATNATTFGVVSEAHGRRVAWAFTGAMLVFAIAFGLVTNEVVSIDVGAGHADAPGHEAHDHAGHDHSGHDHSGGGHGWFASLVFAVSGLFLASSILRLGMRGFLGKLFKGPGPASGDDGHGHGHDHSSSDHCH
ncbi:MAG: permease [Planctomycetota bacterium]